MHSRAGVSPVADIAPVVGGTLGSLAPPTVVAFLVDDPDNADVDYSDGDVILISLDHAVDRTDVSGGAARCTWAVPVPCHSSPHPASWSQLSWQEAALRARHRAGCLTARAHLTAAVQPCGPANNADPTACMQHLGDRDEVDRLFGVSTPLGAAYRGAWRDDSTFALELTDVRRAGTVVRGLTRVYPSVSADAVRLRNKAGCEGVPEARCRAPITEAAATCNGGCNCM